MKKNKLLLIYLLIVLISMLVISSCAQKPAEKPTPKEDEPKSMPPVVEEIEGEIINIMAQVDMIPYYEKQIAEKKKILNEKKELAVKLGMVSQQSSNQGKEEDGQEGEQKKESSPIDELVKFEPKPITINDILLSEVLKAEATDKKEGGTQEIPIDILPIWDDINKKISGLHKKWNTLESQVIKSGVTADHIKKFEDTLNDLTISGAAYNYMDTLFNGNKLTAYIPDLVKNFKKKVPSPIYYMKYHLRQTVLDCRVKNYEGAAENYNKLNIYKDALVSQLIDKKLTELANKLNTSVKDLEDALKLKDLNIIKIKASVVMSNIELVKEEVSK